MFLMLRNNNRGTRLLIQCIRKPGNQKLPRTAPL